MTRTATIFCAIAALTTVVLAEKATEQHDAIITQADELKWGAPPPGLPPGAQAAILEGDPAKQGPFTVRLRAPKGYRIMPHFHPGVEHVTVISGAMRIGMGDHFDEAQTTPVKAGGFFAMPRGHHHFAAVTEESTIQLHGIGPWGITYVDPSDDPRRAKAGTTRSPMTP